MPPKLLAPGARAAPAILLGVAAVAAGCRAEREQAPKAAPSARSAARASASPPASAAPRAPSAAPPALACDEGMALVPGGDFWVGSGAGERFSDDESPRFSTRVAPFCLDVTEVTVARYAECAARGACRKAGDEHRLCNGERAARREHPVNCVSYRDAEAFCAARRARLPTEVEWEFAARGGSAALKYPWGEGSPDGRACWKHVGTCPVKSFAPGAFGLYDLSGNVWEWTETWYGPYPWPPESAYAKVYRGGSFSRRFEKWMHTRLRNRAAPRESGSHLGFRCASTPAGAECPFGADASGRCRHGVVERACASGEAWNGVRCAAPGAPRCRPGRLEKPGFGCVLEDAPPDPSRDLDAEMRAVTRARSPEHDADCRANQGDRPLAFRYSGGSHEARNLVSRSNGCKNRDVGVGWNSTCCSR